MGSPDLHHAQAGSPVASASSVASSLELADRMTSIGADPSQSVSTALAMACLRPRL